MLYQMGTKWVSPFPSSSKYFLVIEESSLGLGFFYPLSQKRIRQCAQKVKIPTN